MSERHPHPLDPEEDELVNEDGSYADEPEDEQEREQETGEESQA